MTPIRHLFFDAGNTLVFPDFSVILEPLRSIGLSPSREDLWSAERKAKRILDGVLLADPSARTDEVYWQSFFAELLSGINPAQALSEELASRARTSANWDRVMPGSRQQLLLLQNEYRLGAISNSDGKIEALLQRVGLRECFEWVFDSALVGHAKPDPRIFRWALEHSGASAAESVYIGDIYSADYWAAERVGMRAVLMDVAGVYKDTGYRRIESMEELSALLGCLD